MAQHIQLLMRPVTRSILQAPPTDLHVLLRQERSSWSEGYLISWLVQFEFSHFYLHSFYFCHPTEQTVYRAVGVYLGLSFQTEINPQTCIYISYVYTTTTNQYTMDRLMNYNIHVRVCTVMCIHCLLWPHFLSLSSSICTFCCRRVCIRKPSSLSSVSWLSTRTFRAVFSA